LDSFDAAGPFSCSTRGASRGSPSRLRPGYPAWRSLARTMSYPGDWIRPVDRSTACEELAARQHGVVSREQALAAGLTKRAIHTRVASGRWDRLHRGVYRALPLPASWHQRLMAAVLHGGPSSSEPPVRGCAVEPGRHRDAADRDLGEIRPTYPRSDHPQASANR
jgi:hypothetical protein